MVEDESVLPDKCFDFTYKVFIDKNTYYPITKTDCMYNEFLKNNNSNTEDIENGRAETGSTEEKGSGKTLDESGALFENDKKYSQVQAGEETESIHRRNNRALPKKPEHRRGSEKTVETGTFEDVVDNDVEAVNGKSYIVFDGSQILRIQEVEKNNSDNHTKPVDEPNKNIYNNVLKAEDKTKNNNKNSV